MQEILQNTFLTMLAITMLALNYITSSTFAVHSMSTVTVVIGATQFIFGVVGVFFTILWVDSKFSKGDDNNERAN